MSAQMAQPNEGALSPDALGEMVLGIYKGRILLTAYELGIFTALGMIGRSAGEVALDLGTAERSTDRLMSALCALGLLSKKEGRYFNTALTSRYLMKDSTDYMSGMMHSVRSWDAYSTLTQAVRQGRPVLVPPAPDQGDESLRTFLTAIHERSSRQAADVVRLLDLTGVCRVLDVGGGSGAYSMALVRAKEAVEATVLELPNVTALTRSYIEAEGLSQRIRVVEGNYHAQSLGEGFDLVLLASVLNGNSAEDNRKLMGKCAAALTTGGQVVVLDLVMEEDRTQPGAGAVFAVYALVRAEGGDVYTEAEIGGWMEEAGLSEIKRIRTGNRQDLMTGRKLRR